jgi:hypothetical protein
MFGAGDRGEQVAGRCVGSGSTDPNQSFRAGMPQGS